MRTSIDPRRNGVLVIGGTTSGILALARELGLADNLGAAQRV